MHLTLLLIAISVAVTLRIVWKPPIAEWNLRWRSTLATFLFSPLLLITSAIAVMCMGPRGQMVRWWEGWGTYAIAVGFLIVAIASGLQLAFQARRSLVQVRQMPVQTIEATPARLLEHSTPFIAQVGFWQPELVVSQGLLDTLDAEHLAVAFTHEQAHRYYRDTFWFFWLGWLRRLTSWLPNTEALWQELMLLRELRADRWAAQHVDSLLLAEALLSVVSASQNQSAPWIAAFSDALPSDRLTERINALLDEPQPVLQTGIAIWLWLSIVLFPLIVVPFHF